MKYSYDFIATLSVRRSSEPNLLRDCFNRFSRRVTWFCNIVGRRAARSRAVLLKYSPGE